MLATSPELLCLRSAWRRRAQSTYLAKTRKREEIVSPRPSSGSGIEHEQPSPVLAPSVSTISSTTSFIRPLGRTKKHPCMLPFHQPIRLRRYFVGDRSWARSHQKVQIRSHRIAGWQAPSSSSAHAPLTPTPTPTIAFARVAAERSPTPIGRYRSHVFMRDCRLHLLEEDEAGHIANLCTPISNHHVTIPAPGGPS